MLSRFLTPLIVLLLLAAPLPLQADETGDKTDRLIDLMGIEAVLRGFPEALVQGMDEAPGAWSGDLSRDAVKELADKHFGPEALVGDLRTLMRGKLSEEHLDAEIAFYGSNFGKRIVELEIAAADPKLEKLIREAGGELYSGLVADGSPRVAMIQKIIDAAGLVEWGMAVGMNVGYAMLTAIYGDQMSEEQILGFLNSNASTLRDEMTTGLNADLAYTYRDLTDEEFQRYIDSLETPSGKALVAAFLDAVRTSMIERSRAFGGELRVLMRQRKS